MPAVGRDRRIVVVAMLINVRQAADERYATNDVRPHGRRFSNAGGLKNSRLVP
jgi:hypothetical protein